MTDMRVNIAGVELKNPVATASGTFGYGREMSKFIDLSRLGAVTVKGLSAEEWKGNPPVRVAEVYGGMLNSVGLQNPGVEYFIKNDLPFLKGFDTRVIVNICGHTLEEYIKAAEMISSADIDFIELNVSCPNVAEGCMAFGTDAAMLRKTVSEVKKYASKPLIVKLSPNVTDIRAVAVAAAEGGADALSLINTLAAMKIDIYKRRPVLANKTGGLSGPAVKPVAVRMVYEVSSEVKLPVIGIGGIMTWEDAVEFIMAGAAAVETGTANLINPYASVEIIDGIKRFMEKEGIKSLSEIRGIISAK